MPEQGVGCGAFSAQTGSLKEKSRSSWNQTLSSRLKRREDRWGPGYFVSGIRPRVLVIEDEPIILMLLEEYLLDAGCDLVASAATLEKALVLAAAEDVDFAILDVSLGAQSSFPVAEALLQRDIPFLFASGFGSQALPAQYRGHRILAKPFDFAELVEGIDATLGNRFSLKKGA